MAAADADELAATDADVDNGEAVGNARRGTGGGGGASSSLSPPSPPPEKPGSTPRLACANCRHPAHPNASHIHVHTHTRARAEPTSALAEPYTRC